MVSTCPFHSQGDTCTVVPTLVAGQLYANPAVPVSDCKQPHTDQTSQYAAYLVPNSDLGRHACMGAPGKVGSPRGSGPAHRH